MQALSDMLMSVTRQGSEVTRRFPRPTIPFLAVEALARGKAGGSLIILPELSAV